MAEGKKSFIAYCEWYELIDDLEDDEAGKVCKWLFRYVNDKQPDFPSEKHLKVICKVMKSQLKTDLVKWEDERLKRSEAGKKGMAVRWQKDNNVITNDNKNNSVINDITKITDNVNDNVNVYVNDMCDKSHNNNACVREETQINDLKSLIAELEKTLNRCLTIYETETISNLSEKYSNKQILDEIIENKDKNQPIAYIKKKIENARIMDQPIKEKQELNSSTWLDEFNKQWRD